MGVYVVGDYSFDRAYMCDEELVLLKKIQSLVKAQITEKENVILTQIIKKYSKSA